MPVIMTKRLLTEKETCNYLSIGRTKLYELVKRRQIIPVRIDSAPRYDLNDLDKFIDKLKEPG